MHDQTPGARSTGELLLDGTDIDSLSDLTALRKRVGHDLPAPEPVPHVDLRQRGLRPASGGAAGPEAARSPDRVERRCATPTCGTKSRTSCASPGWRFRAASSSGSASRARSPCEPEVLLMDEPARRSIRSPRWRSRTDPRAGREVHDRDRHAQHAAGRPRLATTPGSSHGREPHRAAGRVRPDASDLHQPARQAHRRLYQRAVRMSRRWIGERDKDIMIANHTAVQAGTRSQQARAGNRGLNVYYGQLPGGPRHDLKIERRKITALIGPSGCGKSTVLRCFNRMNDLVGSGPGEGQGALPRQEHL